MSYHPKKMKPEIVKQIEPTMMTIASNIAATVIRIKTLDKSLKGYTDIGLMMYALEKLEEDLKEEIKK